MLGQLESRVREADRPSDRQTDRQINLEKIKKTKTEKNTIGLMALKKKKQAVRIVSKQQRPKYSASPRP